MKVIKTEEAYQKALKRIDELMCKVEPNTEQGDELELLMLLVETYENEHYAIDEPDPISAIKFRMEQMGLKQKDLYPLIGDRAVVSKVLSGKRKLTATMIQNLHNALKIPFESLFEKEPVC